MMDKSLSAIDNLEIEPLSDELLDSVAGATSTGASCCSCEQCSNSQVKVETATVE